MIQTLESHDFDTRVLMSETRVMILTLESHDFDTWVLISVTRVMILTLEPCLSTASVDLGLDLKLASDGSRLASDLTPVTYNLLTRDLAFGICKSDSHSEMLIFLAAPSCDRRTLCLQVLIKARLVRARAPLRINAVHMFVRLLPYVVIS